ncbi:fasciclin domain-containing protein [Chitinophaga niabensis]|uniref:fasciclin domain-containing protein n=1 Tax=Chitinophaga niabensis TaxID=536979 RepID=UPI0031BA4516
MKAIKILSLALLVLAASCKKEEFMPVPEGGKIPYEEVTTALQELLNGTNYQLFKQAWNKSNMNSILALKGAKASYTLLVPDDAAMKAAGWNENSINNAAQEDLDTLLMYHTLNGMLDSTAIREQIGNVGRISLLTNPRFTEQLNGPGNAVPYPLPSEYRQYIGITREGELLVNGKGAGTAKPLMAKNGVIWPINKVQVQPGKTILEILQADGRFGLYLEALRINDSLYSAVDGLDVFSMMDYLFLPGLDCRKAEIDWDCFCPKYTPGMLSRFSLFAPTDDAFKKEGLFTPEDIRELASRSKPAYIDYVLQGRMTTDSLLSMHVWGMQGQLMRVDVPPVFYSNDLTPEKLKFHDIQSGGIFSPVTGTTPLEFSKDANGRVQVKYKDSQYEKATVIEGDIQAMQGPIHVVDRLIIPKNFVF